MEPTEVPPTADLPAVGEIMCERRGSCFVITLNRPAARNAINRVLADKLLEALDCLDADPTLKVGVLTGAGGSFCAGVDLKAVAHEGRPSQIRRFLQHRTTTPLIAAVEGSAVAGGLELALACDLVVAGRGARFGIPEVAVGQVAAGGALLRLPALLPHGVATELALTGRLMDAEEAMTHGLLCRLVDTGDALGCALEIAEQISLNAPLSVAATKRLLSTASESGVGGYWEIQDQVAPAVFASNDAVEGPRAFTEKRRPLWSGT